MNRSPLTETFKRVTGMIDYVRENLDEEEYDLFLDLIVPPEPQAEKPKPRKPKKILHCDACDYTKRHQVHKDSSRFDYHEFQSAKGSSKSKRAKSLAGAIQKTPKARVGDDDADRFDGAAAQESRASLCAFIVNDATQETCGATEDDSIHDLTYSSSHEFVSGKSHALAAGEGL